MLDTATNSIVTTIATEALPGGFAVSPDGARVYVTNEQGESVSVIDTSVNQVIQSIAVGQNPIGITASPDGSRVYVANRGDGTVSVIDTSSNAVIDLVAVGSSPGGLSETPAAKRLYVANFDDDTVSVIDTTTNTIVDTVIVGNGPIAFGVFIGPGAAIMNVVEIPTLGTFGSTVLALLLAVAASRFLLLTSARSVAADSRSNAINPASRASR